MSNRLSAGVGDLPCFFNFYLSVKSQIFVCILNNIAVPSEPMHKERTVPDFVFLSECMPLLSITDSKVTGHLHSPAINLLL